MKDERLIEEINPQIMEELGVEPPQDAPTLPANLDIDWLKFLIDLLGKSPKGRSSLTKWTCPECGLNARVGIKGDPQIRHDPCERKSGRQVFFIRADGPVSQTIYKAPKVPELGR